MSKIASLWLAFILAIVGSFETVIADGHTGARRLAEEAYYQMEENVFEPSQLKEAMTKLERARQLDPKEAWVYVSASLATLIQGYKIGSWYDINTFQDGAVDKAMQFAQHAIKLNPRESQAHAQIARLWIIKNEYEQAWEALNKAHELAETSFYPWFYKGVLILKMRNIEKAGVHFNQAEQRAIHQYQKRNINGHRQDMAKLTGDLVLQEELLKQNIQSNPSVPHLYGNYAFFLMNQKRYDEAIKYWEKAIRLGPYRQAIEKLAETKRLKKLQAGIN